MLNETVSKYRVLINESLFDDYFWKCCLCKLQGFRLWRLMLNGYDILVLRKFSEHVKHYLTYIFFDAVLFRGGQLPLKIKNYE